jgi:acyl carrier protein
MSNLTKIEEFVIALVSEIVRTNVSRDSTASELPAWDSLAQMKIVIQLEKTYNIEIEDEYIAKLNSVENIVAYLQGK